MAYSVDFREKILESYLKNEGTNEEIAKRYKISISTVKRIGQRYRETGKIELYLSNIGHHSKVDEAAKEVLKNIISENSSCTLEEMRKQLEDRCQISVSLQAIHYILKKMKITYKKTSLQASQRDREDVKKKGKNLLNK